jgi:hypothetical protein
LDISYKSNGDENKYKITPYEDSRYCLHSNQWKLIQRKKYTITCDKTGPTNENSGITFTLSNSNSKSNSKGEIKVSGNDCPPDASPLPQYNTTGGKSRKSKKSHKKTKKSKKSYKTKSKKNKTHRK